MPGVLRYALVCGVAPPQCVSTPTGATRSGTSPRLDMRHVREDSAAMAGELMFGSPSAVDVEDDGDVTVAGSAPQGFFLAFFLCVSLDLAFVSFVVTFFLFVLLVLVVGFLLFVC